MTDAPRIHDRIEALDVLRGVAVAGILFANVLVFFGIFLMPPERTASLASAGADRIAAFLERVFVEGKFYSIFSLLFGIGFGVQLTRGGDAAVARFKRRLRILLAIGAIHAVLIWAGDILALYALLGFTMPWFARRPDRQLLRWTLILLSMPTVLYAVTLLVWLFAAPSTGAAQADAAAGMPATILDIFARMGTGGFRDALLGNLVLLAGRWVDLVATMRFPKVLGMFVLGLWMVRSGLVTSLPERRPMLKRWMALGWSIGVPACVLGAWAFDRWPYLPPSFGGLLGTAATAIGFPMLALGYAATIAVLVVDRRPMIGVFAPVGRMALTNYLMHSLICVTLSYGFGLGLWWNTGASRAMAIAAAIILVQIPLSALWLRRYRFGPVEYVWRRLTYRQPI